MSQAARVPAGLEFLPRVPARRLPARGQTLTRLGIIPRHTAQEHAARSRRARSRTRSRSRSESAFFAPALRASAQEPQRHVPAT